MEACRTEKQWAGRSWLWRGATVCSSRRRELFRVLARWVALCLTPLRAQRLPQGIGSTDLHVFKYQCNERFKGSSYNLTPMFVSPLFAMSGDGVDDIRIPMVFLFMEEAKKLLEVTSVFYTLWLLTFFV